MSVLLDLRTEIADTLGGLDLTTYTHVPGRVHLPAAFVMAGSPYIEQGQTFGERLVRFVVALVAQTGDNLSETVALDEQIEAAMAVLHAAGWTVESVAQPTAQAFDNTECLVTNLTVATFVAFAES